jgi:endonuclease/exonuclease/phosphatase family metal-dependent hydrolase
MKRLLAILVALAATNIFNLRAEVGTEEHRFATYNLRYTNSTDDTMDNGRAWPARREYVYRLIREYAFDVVGFEEVTGRSAKQGVVLDPSTGLSQREDLVNDLTEYDILFFERDGVNANFTLGSQNDYSYNALAYRKSKYNLLDKGVFWLSPTPDTASQGWDYDYTIKRTCGWAKLQSKQTGDIFFYFVTHCNYAASLDGLNSANLITKKMAEIAGNYPQILCGDFNMSRTNHPVPYHGYSSKLENNRFIANEFKCVPNKNGQTTLTTTEWTPLTSQTASTVKGNEFDYIFSRHLKVLTHNTITENYGRATNPSDHFALMSVCCLINNDTPQDVCVDAEAQEGGDGSVASPLRSIADAIAVARQGDTIRVTAGSYDEVIAPSNRNLVIVGGCDKSFSSIVGKSELSGMAGRKVNLITYDDIYLANFRLSGTESTTLNSDGAVYTTSYSLTLESVDFIGNSAYSFGAGLYAKCNELTLRNCRFTGNTADAGGAGAYIATTGDTSIEDCIFESNDAKSGSAVYAACAATFRMMRSTVSGNTAKQKGVVYFESGATDCSYNLVDNTFANNTLTSPSGLAAITKTFGGTAVYANGVALRMAHNTIAGNKATFAGSNKANFNGAAVNAVGGSVLLINNIIAGNSSESTKADLYLDTNATLGKEQYNLFTSTDAVNITPSAKDFLASTPESGHKLLAECLDGTIDESGLFTANLADNGGLTPTVRVVNPTFADQAIDVLATNLRMVETSFGLDMNGDGKIGGYWAKDQRGEPRQSNSVPGACEVVKSNALTTVDEGKAGIIAMGNNCFRFSTPVGLASVYTLSGTVALSTRIAGTDDCLNLNRLAAGIYIVRCEKGATSFKVVVR